LQTTGKQFNERKQPLSDRHGKIGIKKQFIDEPYLNSDEVFLVRQLIFAAALYLIIQGGLKKNNS
jgi:hypothetical protein